MTKPVQKTSYINSDIDVKIEALMKKNNRSYNYILNDLLRKGLKR